MTRKRASKPIGIFDSGIGGLTVAHAVKARLPEEEILYFGDTAHLPYGDKSPAAILQFADHISSYLIDQECKMIIVACNTASAIAFEHLQKKWGNEALMLNVIDPVARGIAADKSIKKLGVIGTKATIRSNAYEQRLLQLRSDLSVSSLATPLLVSMIEEGFFDNKLSHTIIEAYLNYPDFKDIDAMILGCTHFPLIRKEIDAFFGGKVSIFDSTDMVAEAALALLTRHQLLNKKRRNPDRFLVTDYTHSFEQTSRLFFGAEVRLEQVPLRDELFR